MSRTVVIAGGGPTGLLLAAELALADVPAIVVEARARPDLRSNGMAIHGRSLATLHLRGLAEPIREQAFGWPRTPFSMLWLDLTAAADSDWTFAYPQWRTEALLEQRARELGVQIRRGERVTKVSQDDDGVSVEVSDADGGSTSLRAAYLVGCDGDRSTVREQAGIEQSGAGRGQYGILGDVSLTDAPEDLFDAGPRPGGMYGALPLEPGMIRLMCIEFDADPRTDGAPPTVEELSDSVSRLAGFRPEIEKVHWISRFGTPTRLARTYRAGRVLLAGDAAHSLFISGTQGLNTGLQDAMNLGWKLAATVHGWAPAGLLDTYHAERHPVGERMCMHSEASIAMLHPMDRLAPLREMFAELIALPEVNSHLLRLPSLVRYPMAGTHPLIGTHVEDVSLTTEDGQAGVAELARTGHGLLLDVSGGKGTMPAEVDGWRGRVDVHHAAPVAGWDAEVLLVRPDGHIAYAGSGDDPDLTAALTTWFGLPA
jgi:3-(3-hydroxy-phenyl)propionate hydroxylase